MIILVDSGATHNFISSTLAHHLAHHLQLHIKKTKGCEVTIGNGQQVSGSEVCKGVRLDMQGVQINQHYFLFELRGSDVVLGMEWLATLGEMRVIWKLLNMKFKDAGRSVSLRGDPAMVRTVVSLKAMTNLLKKGIPRSR